tara:strand:- start:101 stop:385 length:285 start_codon:yes stop_codon:yes gene_type:complete
MKKIRIDYSYSYLDIDEKTSKIVQMWTIQGLPFTFEELPEVMQEMEEVKLDAETSRRYTMDELYRVSDYLIAEECHPVLFDLSWLVENYEEVPD